MKIKSITLTNFRAYKDETTVELGDLTTFVGKNDIGKSTILEALDIFFNDGDGVVKMDKNDVNHDNIGVSTTISIAVEFVDLPDSIVIDAQNSKTLSDEYLLTTNGSLKILKEYPNGGKAKVSIVANHPTNEHCKDLLLKKIKDLKEILKTENIVCEDKTRSAVIRKAIWEHFSDSLELKEIPIDTSKEEAKNIYNSLDAYLPLYTLFRADRSNNDSDSEVQDPMKVAVKQIMKRPDVYALCSEIAEKVNAELASVASNTMSKLHDMDAATANSLTPSIPSAENLKWADVFKSVSINSDNEIPLNKRGSGVKRMILISFFRAEVERKKTDEKNLHRGVIYAIEEPETSQHVEKQRILMESLKDLSQQDGVQVILTTHSSFVVKQLTYSNIRVIGDDAGKRTIKRPTQQALPYPSLNEINYTSFADATEEYHNELYGCIQEHAMSSDPKYSKEKDFEQWLVSNGLQQNKQWKRIKGGVVQSPCPVTLQTYIRNTTHHPENRNNAKYTYGELCTSIEDMRNLIMSLTLKNNTI